MGYGYAVYFTERVKHRVLRWEPDSGDVEVVAGNPKDGDATQALRSPYGLAMDWDGQLLIADKLNSRICRLRLGRLESLPLRDMDGHRARRPETNPFYNPEPICPTGLFVEKEGTILCTFADDYTVYRIHKNGQLDLILGIVPSRKATNSGHDDFIDPADIAGTPLHVPTAIVKRSDGTYFFIERKGQRVREYHPGRGLRAIFPRANYLQFYEQPAAPERSAFADYYSPHPASLALDQDENLFLTDVRHGCALQVDTARGEVRKVIEIPPHQKGRHRGLSGLCFGTDGTAWVLNSSSGAVEGYQPNPSGHWSPTTARLTQIRGEALMLASAGSGIVVGA